MDPSNLVLPAIVRVVIEHCRDAVIVLDPAGTIVAANRAATEPVACLDPIRALGSHELTEFRAGLRATGRARAQLHMSSFEGTSVEGLWVVVVREVASASTNEDQARHLRRLESAGLLTLTIAHDMNNLLTPILALSKRLAGRGEASDETRAIAADIQGAAERAATLTRQLLAFGRREPHRGARINVGEVVAAMGSFLDRILGRDVHVLLSLEDRDAEVLADPERLEHVLLNLVTNARDAMPRGGRLTIRTEIARAPQDVDGALRPCVVLTVADTGDGIRPEVRDRIFDPFFTTKEPGIGTGLGLVSARQFVLDSHGHVAVESEVGQGTAVHVYLPCADP